MIKHFDRFTIEMTKKQAESASHNGDCELDVLALLKEPKIKRMLAKIAPADIRKELKEYGAWDETELANDYENLMKIVWIAAIYIREGC